MELYLTFRTRSAAAHSSETYRREEDDMRNDRTYATYSSCRNGERERVEGQESDRQEMMRQMQTAEQ